MGNAPDPHPTPESFLSGDRVSVDLDRLDVGEALDRLAAVRERLREGVDYDGREEDVEEQARLEGKVLAEGTAAQLRAEWHDARERVSSDASTDPDIASHDRSWEQYTGLTFLRRADTADLAAEAAALAQSPDTGWRQAVDDEWHRHGLVDGIADLALEELSRWDELAGSGADGDRLRELTRAAEKLGGADGLEQFLHRLEAADHPFHSDQLEHYCATVGREYVAQLAGSMEGRDVELHPVEPIGSFVDSFWEDVKSGQVRDNLATIAGVVAQRLADDAERAVDVLRNPGAAIGSALESLKDLPGDVADTIRSLPELPDRLAAAARAFAQADEQHQVAALAGALYEVEKGLVVDAAVAKLARVAPEVADAGAPAPGSGGPELPGPGDTSFHDFDSLVATLNDDPTVARLLTDDRPPLARREEPWGSRSARAYANAQAKAEREAAGMEGAAVQAGHTAAARHAPESGISPEDWDSQPMMHLHSRKDPALEVHVTTPEGVEQVRTRHTAQEGLIDDSVARSRAAEGELTPRGQLDAAHDVAWRAENTPWDQREVEALRKEGRAAPDKGRAVDPETGRVVTPSEPGSGVPPPPAAGVPPRGAGPDAVEPADAVPGRIYGPPAPPPPVYGPPAPEAATPEAAVDATSTGTPAVREPSGSIDVLTSHGLERVYYYDTPHPAADPGAAVEGGTSPYAPPAAREPAPTGGAPAPDAAGSGSGSAATDPPSGLQQATVETAATADHQQPVAGSPETVASPSGDDGGGGVTAHGGVGSPDGDDGGGGVAAHGGVGSPDAEPGLSVDQPEHRGQQEAGQGQDQHGGEGYG